MSEFNELIKESKPTLVDFYATWCGPCRMQSPIIEKVKEEIGDAANVIKVDIDKNEAVARKYNVQSIPTLIMWIPPVIFCNWNPICAYCNSVWLVTRMPLGFQPA